MQCRIFGKNIVFLKCKFTHKEKKFYERKYAPKEEDQTKEVSFSMNATPISIQEANTHTYSVHCAIEEEWLLNLIMSWLLAGAEGLIMNNKERYFEEKVTRIYESIYLGKAEEEMVKRIVAKAYEEKQVLDTYFF